MESPLPRPPFDPKLAPILPDVQGWGGNATSEELAALRKAGNLTADDVLQAHDAQATKRKPIPNPDETTITLSIFHSKSSESPSPTAPNPPLHPAIYYLHGRGLLAYNRSTIPSPAPTWLRMHCGGVSG